MIELQYGHLFHIMECVAVRALIPLVFLGSMIFGNPLVLID